MNIKHLLFLVLIGDLLVLVGITSGRGVIGRGVAANSQVRLKVVSTTGGEMLLDSPISGDWEFTVGDFSIRFTLATIKRVERKADGTFELTPVTGNVFKVKAKTAGKIQGEGEWGQTSLAWKQTKSVEVIAAAASTPETPDDKKTKTPLWQVTSLDGTVLELRDLSKSYYQWEFTMKDFTIQVAVDRLKSFEYLKDGKEWRITYLNGKTFEAVPVRPDDEVRGTTTWGPASIIFSKVNKIVRITEEPPVKEESKSESEKVASLSLRSGLTMDVTTMNGPWHFMLHEAEIDVDPQRISSLEASDETNMFRINGQVLRIKEETRSGTSSGNLGPTLSCETTYGKLTVPWNQVQRITRISKSAVTPSGESYPFMLETVSGAMIAAGELKPESMMFAGMKVENLQWSAVQSVSVGNNAFTLRGADDFAITLTGGILKGKTNLGGVTMPLISVRQIKITSTGDSGISVGKTLTSEDKLGQIAAKVTFENGISATRVRIRKSGSNNIKIHGQTTSNLLELRRNGLRFWVGCKQLVNSGFKSQAGRWTMNLLGASKNFDPPEQEVVVVTSIATLTGELRHLSEIVPDENAGKTASDADKISGVIVECRDSTQETFRARQMWFANYPATGWTGSYYTSEWPFQWWPEESIDIVRDQSSERMSVNLSKLASIEVLGNYTSRRLRFKSLEGNELIGTHFSEVLNEDRKHGPSKWKHEDEGILLKLEDDLFVFLPFLSINKISFPQ